VELAGRALFFEGGEGGDVVGERECQRS